MQEEVITAYHEAGHALLAEQLGGHVLMVTLEPVDDDGPRRHGETVVGWARATTTAAKKHLLTAQLQVSLAGPAVELIFTDEQYEPRVLQEWAADWQTALACARELAPKHTLAQNQQQIAKVLFQLLEHFSDDAQWETVARLADHLEAHQTLETQLLDELRGYGVLG